MSFLKKSQYRIDISLERNEQWKKTVPFFLVIPLAFKKRVTMSFLFVIALMKPLIWYGFKQCHRTIYCLPWTQIFLFEIKFWVRNKETLDSATSREYEKLCSAQSCRSVKAAYQICTHNWWKSIVKWDWFVYTHRISFIFLVIFLIFLKQYIS